MLPIKFYVFLNKTLFENKRFVQYGIQFQKYNDIQCTLVHILMATSRVITKILIIYLVIGTLLETKFLDS